MTADSDSLHSIARSPNARFVASEVRRGLAAEQKTLSSSLFYDARGSELFRQITRLPEYYLTRSEREILETRAADIAGHVGDEPFRLLEIGAGDGHKTEVLLREFIRRGGNLEYLPIDICRKAVAGLTRRLRKRLNGDAGAVRLSGIVADHFDAFKILRRMLTARTLALFLGSSIGNFGAREARRLLLGLRSALAPGDLALIGFDLKKDRYALQRAYDDKSGVTREFNFNLLDRINRDLNGRFDRRDFEHIARYNPRLDCMESWLRSRRRQSVPIERLNLAVRLDSGESIRVERSYKYDLSQIETLAQACGFRIRDHFFDRRRWFVDSLWEAVT
jgi:dimethylhistidine N-methyltransferase